MRVNYLFDFYQTLLTPKQTKYMEMYYLDDLSLVEISELANVSRQAVYDNVKRTEEILESYESKLGLYSKFMKRTSLLDDLDIWIAKNVSSEEINTIIYQLKELG